MSVDEVDQVLDGATRVVKRSFHPQGMTLRTAVKTIASDLVLAPQGCAFHPECKYTAVQDQIGVSAP
jgi:hypothetical protein